MTPNAYVEFGAWLLECRGVPAPEWETLSPEVQALWLVGPRPGEFPGVVTASLALDGGDE